MAAGDGGEGVGLGFVADEAQGFAVEGDDDLGFGAAGAGVVCIIIRLVWLGVRAVSRAPLSPYAMPFVSLSMAGSMAGIVASFTSIAFLVILPISYLLLFRHSPAV